MRPPHAYFADICGRPWTLLDVLHLLALSAGKYLIVYEYWHRLISLATRLATGASALLGRSFPSRSSLALLKVLSKNTQYRE
jgi:presenilin-like A22 family membrane protease